ncbi:carboxypeptidase-like regulatory domain-containing protein [Oceanobacillus alkalisoli]|uniref:carboxypeptidase-like regulatory domain-containing protein n=1 Tax=Oceanobacillus alkalisoli TaxID=2925113 RepID=UPI001EE462FC|nr:carboxypeptidase-like regulatory domain-containing protein [Oceanobacillus alkalisoli]MCG5103915.1 carboxypeptidase-like regulatory domain-containing protein [Oceanobacillus alkalisoli]
MRNNITLKVKHLIMIITGVFILLPLASIYLMPQLELGLVKYKHTNGSGLGKDKILELLEDKILPSQKYHLIEEHFLTGEWMDDYAIYVGPSMTTSVAADRDWPLISWEEKQPYIEDYLENGPLNGYLETAVIELAYEAVREEDDARLQEIYHRAVERLEKSEHSYIIPELKFSFIKLHLQAGNLAEAKTLLEHFEVPDHAYAKAQKEQYEALLLLGNGQLEEALETVQQGLEEYIAAWEREGQEDPVEQTGVYEEMKKLENHLLSGIPAHGVAEVRKVSGNMSRQDGTPIKEAGVFLRDAADVNSSIRPDEWYQTTTDAAGNYEFAGVIPGDYQVFAGFQVEQIDGYFWPVEMNDWVRIDGTENVQYDITLAPLLEVNAPANEAILEEETIDFSWEAVEGAAYYMLDFHIEESEVSYGMSWDRKVEGNQLSLPVESLYNIYLNVLLDIAETKNDYFNPATMLGFENPEGHYSWNVKAFDKNGNLITQSNGYRLAEETIGNLPTMYLKQRELTAEDELLLAGELEQALDGYRNVLTSNPEDLHSLRMVARLIGIEADGSFSTTQKLQQPYYEQLAGLTADPIYIDQILRFYYEESDWEQFEKWYQKYKRSLKETIDPHTKSIHANALLFQGEYEAAADLHMEALQEGSGHHNIGNLLALEIYLGTDLDEVYDLARQYPYMEYTTGNVGVVDWSVLISDIKKAVNEHTRVIDILHEGLRFFFKEQGAKLEEWKEQTEQAPLTKFIHALEEVN